MPPKKKSRPPRRTGKKSKKSGDRLQLRVAVAALFVLGFLVASLVGLSYLRESLQGPERLFEEAPRADRGREILEDIRVELESALLRSGLSLTDLETSGAEGPVRIEVRGDFPPPPVLADLERRLTRLDPQIRFENRPAGREIDIHWRGTHRFALRFRPQPVAPVPLPPAAGRAQVAIIMDDLGQDLAFGRALLAIDLPVTFAIMPGNTKAREVAVLAHRHGREVLVHMPMEPRDFPAINPGSDALFVRMPAGEIQERVRSFLGRVPHAVGGNNHMGSRFTEDPAGMQAVMSELRDAGLFFVDSLTSGRSVGLSEARRAGVPAAVRDVFLDNEQEVDRIVAEIRRLVRVARRQGQAIGICHPYPETLEALRRETAALKEAGVEVVPVSRLVR